MIAADLRTRRAKPHTTWHLDEVYLRIGGRMVYLWRAVDAEGEVLDVLVQSKRNKHAALKLMRKLLKKYALAPERLVTDDLRSYRLESLASNAGMWAGDGRTIEQRIRISRRGGGNARCSGSRGRGQPRNFFPHTPPSTTRLMSNATLSQLKLTVSFTPTADSSRGGLTIPETLTLRARRSAT